MFLSEVCKFFLLSMKKYLKKKSIKKVHQKTTKKYAYEKTIFH